MEDIDINIPEERFVNDFTIIYKGGKERVCDKIEQIEEIKTSKEELLRKLRYFKAKDSEIKYLKEIYIHDKYPVQIFREFINSIKTRHIKVNESNYLTLLEMSSKYEYQELQEQIKIFSETRPDLNNIINQYEIGEIDSNKEENISKHLDICLRNKNMLNFPIPVLNRILNSPTRVINDHHLLYNFIKQVIQKFKHQTKTDQNEHNDNNDDKERENIEILLGSLDYSQMSNEELDEFLNETNFSFVFNSKGMRDKMKEMKEERNNFESIISTLEKKINTIESKMKETESTQKSQFAKFVEEMNESMNKKLEQQEQIISSIQKENEQLRQIIQKHESKFKKIDQQNQTIFDIQKENENLKEIIQKHEVRIQKLEQQNQIASNIQKENENLKEIIQKHELKIQKLEKPKECQIAGEIAANVENQDKIKGTINLRCIDSSNEFSAMIDKTKSKYIINLDDSASLSEISYEGGILIENSSQTFEFKKETGIYYIHAILYDKYGQSKQIISKSLNVTTPSSKTENQSTKTFSPTNDKSICGIINFLYQKSNKNIENEINITASSYSTGNEPRYSLSFDDLNKFHCSKNTPNSWICYEFKNHRIIPTHYTIRTMCGGSNAGHLRNWVIECSTDNNSWETIDEEVNNSSLNGKNYVHTFKINKQISTEFRYIRIRSTGKDWCNSNWLTLNLFEIYGKLI